VRPLEIFALIVLAVTLVAIPITWSKRPGWLRFLPAIPAIVMVFQVLVEGYRWQMVPAYALSVILFLAGLPTMIRGQRTAATPRRVSKALAIIGSFIGLAIVWVTVELCVQVPVFSMPVPSGPYAVGTRTFLLVDESRIDNDSPISNGYRTMSIQAWYPAELTGEEERIPYLQSDIRNEMEELDGPPVWFLGYQDLIRTYAHWEARIAETDEQFPVILYSPSGNASLHKILFEELASQGYVVVSISHPHWSNVLFDDQGEIIPQGGVGERYQAWFQEENTSAAQEAKAQILGGDIIGVLEQAQIALNQARPIAISELRQWSEDVGFVLDQLAEMNLPGSFFDGQIDLSRTGVMGFSLGGANAGQFCVTDSRCRVGINIDGFMFGDILDRNLRVPFMFIHSDNPEVKPGLAGALFYKWAENSAYIVQITGAVHGDLGAPAPTGRPVILQLGLSFGQFPDGAYLAQIMNDYILAFFDKHLLHKPAPLLDGPSPYPEVMFMEKDGN
jgi:predicted dienelactone hydrolase